MSTSRDKALIVALVAGWLCVGPIAASHGQGANPQIDQYIENLPDSGGGQPTGDDRGGGGGDPDQPVLDPQQRNDLEDRGADGAAVAGLTEQTSPAGGAAGQGEREDGGSSPNQRNADPPAARESAASADQGSDGGAPSAVDSDDGLGVALPLIVGALAVGAGAYALWRRRAAGSLA